MSRADITTKRPEKKRRGIAQLDELAVAISTRGGTAVSYPGDLSDEATATNNDSRVILVPLKTSLED